MFPTNSLSANAAEVPSAATADTFRPHGDARRNACELCEERIGDRCLRLGRGLRVRRRDMTVDCPLGNWPRIELDDLVTIGVTTFLRPESLQRLTRSIARHYPRLKVEIVDTRGNLSWGRNELARRCKTPYLLLCEDDFEFSDETRIETLLEVLNHDHEIGGVGGVLIEDKQRTAWACDFDCFRGRCEMTPARRPPRVTPGGAVYQPCELILNFGLFRRDVFFEFPWDENLPLGEHRDWYWTVAQSHRWRMALCREVSIAHHRDRPDGYDQWRNRSFRNEVREKHGFVFSSPPKPQPAKPDVLLLGVGHSGTTIVARQMFELGWQAGDADEEFAESVAFRRLNRSILRTGKLDHARALKMLGEMPRPWLLKDPRLVETLPHWLPVLARLNRPPLLIWLRRDVRALAESYRRRGETNGDGEPAVRGHDIESLCELAAKNYEQYPWRKFDLAIEQIARAVAIFDPTRILGGT